MRDNANNRHLLACRRAWALRWRSPLRSRQVAARVLDIGSANAAVPRRALGWAAHVLAWHARWTGEFCDAVHRGRQALDQLDTGDDASARAHVLSTLAVVSYGRGDHASAHRLVAEGFDLLDGLSAPEASIDLFVTLSTLHQYSRDFDKSLEYLDRAAEIARQNHLPAEVARILHNRSRSCHRSEDYAEAERLARDALKLAVSTRNVVIEPYALEVLASAQMARGDPVSALTALVRGEQLADRVDDVRAKCQLLHLAGDCHLKNGDLDEALACFLRGKVFLDSVGYPLWQRNFFLSLSRTCEQMGRDREALDYLKKYCAVQDRMFSEESERLSAEVRATTEYQSARREARIERNLRAEMECVNIELLKAHETLLQTHRIIEHNSLHDSLTDIPNRRYVESFIGDLKKTAGEHDGTVACLQIDLDGFKDVNDTMGHAAGDHILVSVAKRLSACIGPGDFVARIGGDEFLYIATNASDPKSAGSLAAALIAEINRPIEFEGAGLQVGASIGVAILDGRSSTCRDYFTSSDRAMYQAKRLGKNRYHISSNAHQLPRDGGRALAG